MAEYTKEQLWELYEQLPEDLQKAVFSEQIGEKVRNFCYDSAITDEKTQMDVLKNIGYVFLGLLTPDEFRSFLKRTNAERVFAKINNEILLELKESLESLYGTKLSFEKIENAPIKKSEIEDQDEYRETIK